MNQTVLKCANCGFENEAQALFCGNCGKPLSADVPTPPNGGPSGNGGDPEPGPTTGGNGAGTEDPDGPDGPVEETITCPHCQTVNPVARVICSFCAKKLRPNGGPIHVGDDEEDDNGDARRWKQIAIGLGVVAGVAAIAIIGLLLLNGGGPKATASPPPTSPATVGPTASGPTSTPTSNPTASSGEGEPSGRIAFSRCPAGGGPCVVFVINADGTGLTPLTSGSSATDPALSHDGTRVLYVLGNNGIWLRELAAAAPTPHSTGVNDVSPTWAWDNRQIAFAGNRPGRDQGSNDDREIRLDTLDPGNRSVALTRNELDDHDPVFTPDGAYIFWARGAGQNRELWRVELATEKKLRVTTNTFDDVDPAISPDGTKLVFVSNREPTDGSFDLWLLDPRDLSLPPTRLADIPGDQHDPAWSPGGRYIVFASEVGDNIDLLILDVEAGGAPFPLTSTADPDRWPSWSVAAP